MRRFRAFAVAVLFALGCAAGPALPQDNSLGEVTSAIVVVDQERLFGASAWGKRVETDIAAASAALASENRRIEADLTEEEKSLTARRATMEPGAFRTEADAFDAKVVAIRSAQDSKSRDVAARRDRERQAFFAAALPYIGAAMEDRGAVAILDKRSVFLSINAIDVTEDLIARIDSGLGAGPATVPPPPAVPDRAVPTPPKSGD